MVGGVCAGLAEYFDIDPTLVRVAWVIAAFCASVGFWAYLICAIIILAGMLGTSRIYMNRHTFWQVVAGFANGYICVYALSKLLA